jgi:threonine aldolase
MIDLLSDTATKPTAEMRQAMYTAEVGDEQRGEDPTVNRLLQMVCSLLNKEAGLFLPSGTMCNGIAVKTHTQPGETILVDRQAHILRSESGGAAFLSGVIVDQLPSNRGRFTADDVNAAIPRETVYVAPPRLLCVEQTHNAGGGSIWPLEQLSAVCDTAHQHGLAVHMDGARLLNAVVATSILAPEYTKVCDSVWIDFTKGLGAPLGAVLSGTATFIERARRYKHLFGGALRQAGIVAAGCIYALENHIERLHEDHLNAHILGDGLGSIAGIQVEYPIETNMVYFNVSDTGLKPDDFLALIEKYGVRMGASGKRIRAVTHLNISGGEIEKVINVVWKIVRET